MGFCLEEACFRLEVAHFRLGDGGFKFQVSNFRFGDTRFRFEDGGFKFQVSNFRFGVTRFQLGVAHFPKQVRDRSGLELLVSKKVEVRMENGIRGMFGIFGILARPKAWEYLECINRPEGCNGTLGTDRVKGNKVAGADPPRKKND
jgi:hypothetical protein